MRILFLSQYYPPESNPPANRVSRLARHWTQAGAEVEVLTGFPNHPDGKIYRGYQASWPQRHDDAGVTVSRVPFYLAANSAVVKRSLSFASYCVSASLLGLITTRRPDVVVATSPQLLTAVAGLWHAGWRRRPFVFDVRDLWPEPMAELGILSARNPFLGGLAWLAGFLNRRADRIVVVTESFREILIRRGVAPQKLTVIPNGVDGDLFHPSPDDPAGDRDPYGNRFVVMFAGTVGMAHGLEVMLDAAIRLRDQPDVLFAVVGDGAERDRLRERAKSLQITNVLFQDRVPREAIPGLLRRADLNLIMLKDLPAYRSVLPSKLFESMGCGRPILLGVDGEARRLVEKAGAGLFFHPGDAAALAAAVCELKAQPERRKAMGIAGRAFALEHYDRRVLAEQYLNLLKDIVAKRRAPVAVSSTAAARSGD